MLDIKSCLKISYQGEVSFIICEAESNYERIIEQAASRFQIPQSQRAGLVLTNGQGYVFERQLLEYFLLLFPCPELVFYLRVDWQRLRRAVVEPIRQRRRSTGEINERTKLNESTVKDGGDDYVAVPVHRQNCFLGVLPTSSVASTVSATPLRRQSCFLRLRQQQQQPTASTSSVGLRRSTEDQPQTQAKRMRLQQSLHNMRRSVPPIAASASASSRAALLTATATKRSIRI